MPKPTDLPAEQPHGRTPDNTPIPGGGRWAWDAESSAWVSLDAPPATDTALE